MTEWISYVNERLGSLVWGTPMLILLMGTGILMTCLTGVFQFRRLGHWMRCTLGSIFMDQEVTKHTEDGDPAISQFQSMCTTLAATIGTGNIVGVSSALVTGGPGAVFWMWTAAVFGMMTNFAENVLGIYYRRKNERGEWCGGAMYYLRDGLGARKGCGRIGAVLAALFALFCLLASFGIGNMSQVNSVAGNMYAAFGVDPKVTGAALTVLGGMAVLGGIRRIAGVAEKLVPFMAIVYIIGTVTAVVLNFDRMGAALESIFRGAFGIRAVGGGIVGTGARQAAAWGIKRGVFSNEAGLGSTVMANASSNVREPVRQGMWGIFEVFADTIVVCSLTAFAVLSSGLVDLETGAVLSSASGTALVGEAFARVYGTAGPMFIAIAILLFAFATVLGWSHYGAKAFEYLFGTERVILYRILFIIFIFVGAVMNLDLVWSLSDTFNGLMALPNLIGVLALAPVVCRITENYAARCFRKEKIPPMLSAFEDQDSLMRDLEGDSGQL